MDLIKEEIIGFVNTPSISNSLIKGIGEFCLPDFKISNDLPEFKQHTFLGKRMEAYFQYAIEHSETHDVVASNFQVKNVKQTVGEIDYLIKDLSSNKVSHVELSYKFYLLDTSLDGAQIQQWIGPNRNDSLVKKITKLKTHQFPLLKSELVLPVLDELGLSNVDQYYCLKANLFLPYQEEVRVEDVNLACIQGFWLTVKQLEDFSKYEVYIPEKKHWSIDPKKVSDQVEWLSYSEGVKEILEINDSGLSPLVWLKGKDLYLKVFVVNW